MTHLAPPDEFEHQFLDEDVAEFRKVFDKWNTNDDEAIDVDEMRNALINLGVDGDRLSGVVQVLDEHKGDDEELDFEEFLNALWKAENAGRLSGFVGLVQRELSLIEIETASGGLRSMSQDEVCAFASHLNHCLANDPKLEYLMPIDPNTMDLMEKVQDGVLLACFVNKIEKDTIDVRALNYDETGGLKTFSILENQNMNISAAKAIGVQVTNISAEDLMEAPDHPTLVLGLLWQMVRMQLMGNINLLERPELIQLVEDGEEMGELLAMDPETILKRWVNHHMERKKYPGRINNFGPDLKDGKVYTVLLSAIGKEHGCTLEPLEWEDDRKRANKVLSNALKLGTKPFLTAADIIKGNDKFNLAFVAQLFNTNPGLDPVDGVSQRLLAELMDEDNTGDSREAKAFKMWMNSLGIEDFHVHYLSEDCHDGCALLKVINKINPDIVNWKKAELKASNKFNKLQNANYAVDLGKEMKFSMVNVGGADIVEKNKKLILGFAWQLMRFHLLKMLSVLGNGKPLSDKDVLEWCNNKIAESELEEKPKIKSFKDGSISSGLYFIHLLAAIEPNMVNWDLVTEAMSEEDKRLNARYAISLARKLGAVVFVLPEDIMEVRSKMCMTFCSTVMARALDARDYLYQ